MADLTISELRSAFVGPVTFTIPSGTCATLSGPSGAGKSLLLRMIADLDPNEGLVHLGALDRATMAAPLWRQKVSYLAAEAGWWAATVGAHFAAEARSEVLRLAIRLGLDPDSFERSPSSFSTGERQRLALIRTLVRGPDVLLLDEPTSALDPASIARVEEVLDEIRSAGTTLFIASHDRAQAARLGSQHYSLAAGRLVGA